MIRRRMNFIVSKWQRQAGDQPTGSTMLQGIRMFFIPLLLDNSLPCDGSSLGWLNLH